MCWAVCESLTVSQAMKLKKDYLTLVGNCTEMLASVEKEPTKAWMASLCESVRTGMAELKIAIGESERQILIQDGRELRKLWGDDTAVSNFLRFSDAIEPKLDSLEKLRLRLEKHMRVG